MNALEREDDLDKGGAQKQVHSVEAGGEKKAFHSQPISLSPPPCAQASPGAPPHQAPSSAAGQLAGQGLSRARIKPLRSSFPDIPWPFILVSAITRVTASAERTLGSSSSSIPSVRDGPARSTAGETVGV